VNVLNMQ